MAAADAKSQPQPLGLPSVLAVVAAVAAVALGLLRLRGVPPSLAGLGVGARALGIASGGAGVLALAALAWALGLVGSEKGEAAAGGGGDAAAAGPKRPAGLPPEPLSSEEEREARLLFELCDTDGSETLSMHEFIAMCVKHPHVSGFLGFPSGGRDGLGKRASADLYWESMGCGGRGGEIGWEHFKLVVARQRAEKSSSLAAATASSVGAGEGAAASRPALIADEDELDLIFDMCDADNNGLITMTELAAFCVMRPLVAQSVGLVPIAEGGPPTVSKRRSRPCVETLFASMDANHNGVIDLREFRNFVAQQRAKNAAARGC